MKRGLRLTNKKQKNTEQAPPPPPKATRTSRYAPAPQAVPDVADEDETDELDEAATGWQQTTVKMAGFTKLVTVVVWILVVAGPLLAFFAVVVASSSRATPVARAGQSQSQASATGPAGFAELYVTAYLSAGEGTEEDLLPYYSEPVSLSNKPNSRHATSVTTVAAEQVDQGYWAVTVAARISAKDKKGKTTDQGLHYFRVGVQVAGTPEAGGTAKPTVSPTTATSSASTGVAKSPKPSASPKPSGSPSPEADTGPTALYAATSLPAEVNAPASATHGGLVYGADRSAHGGPVSDTISRFFAAYLTGQGELDRYVSPGLQVAAIVPAPYQSTLVTGLRDDQDKPAGEAEEDTVPADGTTRRVLVSLSATAGGQDYLLTYALTLNTRDGRWEVAAVETAPALDPEQAGPVRGTVEPEPQPSTDSSSDSAED
ncbi:conjugal transfer protein [Streptomyces sp. NPDC087866]|uniref:conjugal transfer protein n=1 Tax=unclassified Streptomyces TaxID=2593676 RepID=UPI002251E706|nr:conjugal transfer protein [Streptomyces sp. NBC_01789]MCX4448388.1 conjugal transfer protein [Streptomyces sp. NBC_01789]